MSAPARKRGEAVPLQESIVEFMLQHPAEVAEAHRRLFPTPPVDFRGLSLTPRQQALLHFIRAFQDERGITPNFDEMREGIGLQSKSGIARLLDGLEERGLVRRRASRARSLVLLTAKEASPQ